MASDLHSAIQELYAGETGAVEVPVQGYRVDVVRDGVAYEVQTSGLGTLKAKLQAVSRCYPVTVVYPLCILKRIVRLHPVLPGQIWERRSPRKGTIHELFGELVYVAQVMAQVGAGLDVLLTSEREFRCADGKGAWRNQGVSRVNRELLEVLEVHRFEAPEEYHSLLPDGLAEPFSVAELAQAASIKPHLARKMAYSLLQLGALRRVGKAGNAHLYERAEPSKA